MNIKRLQISEIKPYWRNPRDNDEDAINAVVESIKEFGYQSPIIVDKDNVIIAGDTRYKALIRLGADQVDVIVSDMDEEQARGYRIMDNKTSEKAEWNWEKLIPELRAFKSLHKFEAHFPELKLKPIEMNVGTITQQDIEKHLAQTQTLFQNSAETVQNRAQKILCPHCNEEFELL